MDPHTATCFKAYETCADKPLKTIVYSTAEWTKFSPTMAEALTGKKGVTDIEALKLIAEKADINIPQVIHALFDKPIIQDSVIDKADIEAVVLDFI